MSGVPAPPPLTLTSAFTQWVADPLMIAVVVILLAAYLAAVRTVRRRGQAWGTGRIVAFAGIGIGATVIATMSWTGVYQGYLFYARASQTVLLVLVAPLFLAMGRPITLVMATFPGAAGRIEAIIGSRAAKAVTFPAITALALVAVPMVMYFTSWYTAAFHSAGIRELTYLAFMVPGFVFFWTLLRVDPVPKAYSYGISMWITAAEVVGDAFFGIAIIADNNLIGRDWYGALPGPWHTGLATKQVIGGGVIWILGDMVGLPFLAAQLIQLMREDREEAAVIDAELDARDATRAARAAAAGIDAEAGASGASQPEPDSPWWQDDPRFTGRFKAT